VVANLEALRSPAGGSVVGSVTRADAPAVQNRGPGGVATIPRTLEAFAALALKAGWAIDRSIAAPLSFNVRLT
jgi:hypothetical protein